MFPSDSLPSEIRFRQAYTLSLYLSVMGRVSPVPNYTFHTYRFLYTEGFFRAVFQFLHTFHDFRLLCPRLNFPFLSFETFLTIRQNSLYVTVCMIARPSYQGYFIHSLSTLYYYNAPSLATRLTGDYRDRTYTGKCSPALLDTRIIKKMSTFYSTHLPHYFNNFSSHSFSLNPVSTNLSPTTNGLFTNIPSVASSFICSSSVIVGSLSFSCICL